MPKTPTQSKSPEQISKSKPQLSNVEFYEETVKGGQEASPLEIIRHSQRREGITPKTAESKDIDTKDTRDTEVTKPKTGKTDIEDVGKPLVTETKDTDLSPLEQKAMQGLQDTQDFYETQIDTYSQRMDNLRDTMATQNQALIDNIKNTYARRKQQMRQINKARVGNVRTAQIRSGRARYAPTLSEGAIGSEEREGLQRITDLDNKMNSAINQARMAATKQDYKMLNQTMNNLTKMHENQTENLLQQLQLARDSEDRALEKAKDELEIKEMGMEIKETKAANAATSALPQLTQDPEKNKDLIQKTADQYGVDYEQVASQVLELQQEQQKMLFERGEDIFDIAKQLPEGDTYIMPDGTVVEGVKEEDPDIVSVTKTIGNNKFRFEYKRDPDTGKLKQLGQPINLGARWKPTGDGDGDRAGISELESIAEDEREAIVRGKTNFTEAFDRIRAIADDKNLNVTNDDINTILGGEIPYEEETGIFKVEEATGLADPEAVYRRRRQLYKQGVFEEGGEMENEFEKQFR